MPRIDPQQLLNCLQVLLTPNGGILSKDEVQRLANLMTKFSKKLVSKCIYVLILKNTDKQLLGSFMAEGGWNLIHNWLQDAHLNKNWALVTEVLELLLISPVDVDRLKMNNLPKLIKSLTKRDDLAGIQLLATNLVDEWLKLVKDATKAEAAVHYIDKKDAADTCQQLVQNVTIIVEKPSSEISDNVSDNVDNLMGTKTFGSDDMGLDELNNGSEESSKESDKKDDKRKDKSKHRSSSSSKSSNSKDKMRDKSKSSRSSSSSSRDKDKKDKEKHRNNGSSSSSSSSSSLKHRSSSSRNSRDRKEKQAERDRDTLTKIQPSSTMHKLGRIPRKDEKSKSSRKDEAKKEDVKRPTFSVEVRKTNEEKPKTVKVFNSKMRSTGLLEEAKPPPPRTSTKKTPPQVPASLSLKRPSPIRDAIPPPEKKSRLLDVPERPGAIKLIPPKPKPAVLQESDIFMDALTAATTKKEVKKRKRRPSTSKEGSPPSSPATGIPASPTTNIKSITPANFYQDTLDTQKSDDKDKENEGDNENKGEIPDTPAEPDEDITRVDANGLKGVLCYGKRRGPKRSIRWRPDTELVEIQYFELDETERVNVMKPFMDMARMEMTNERDALRARKLPNEDTMDVQLSWNMLIEIDLPAPQAEIGSKSLEKEIQFAREKRVLQALYFNNRIPDSASEPDFESYQKTNPIIIPLDDPDNPDPEGSVPTWPEPKGSPPHVPNPPPVFTNIPGPQFIPPNTFPPNNGIPPFGPGFMPPNMMRPPAPEWNGMPPPNMHPPDMMNPPMFDNFNPNMQDNGYPPPFNPPPPMFPPNNFNNMRGRGGFRRGNNGPWLRMAGPGPNQGWSGRGGPSNRGGGGRYCLNIKKHGYCRNRDNCPFIHPN